MAGIGSETSSEDGEELAGDVEAVESREVDGVVDVGE